MINKTKIAIIKSILESDTIKDYNKMDFVELVVNTEVDEKSKIWLTTENGTNPL